MEEIKNGGISDEMNLSIEETLPEDKLSKQDIEIPLENTITNLPLDTKYHQRINLRWLYDLHRDSLVRCFILNPEFQIEILEEKESFNFFTHKSFVCDNLYNLQIKNNTCIFKTKMPSLSEVTHKHISGTNLKSNLLLKDIKELISNVKHQSNSEFSDKIQLTTNINIDTSDSIETKATRNSKNQSTNSIVISPLESKCINELNNLKAENPPLLIDKKETPLKSTITINSKTEDTLLDLLDDIDNQFEFTIKQENIVSFVCSPTSPRKECSQSDTFLTNCENVSDTESEKQTKSCYSGGDTWSETVSNLSCKSNCLEKYETTSNDKNHILLKQMPTVNKFLCDSPLSLTSTDRQPSLSTKTLEPPTCKCPLSPQHDSFNNISNDEKCNYETILFREASLRSCYNIENILKETKPLLPEVEKEINDVKRLIFSAVGLKRTNLDMMRDSVLSILDICKSWIKLNSHFERKEFKDALKIQGVDISLLHDFLKWQNVSRLFIDKMVQSLSKIASHSTLISGNCENVCNFEQKKPTSSLTSSQEFVKVRQKSLNSSCNNLVEELRMLQKCENIFPKNHQAQNKHWKQRHCLLEQLQMGELENKTKRLLKSKFTLNSSSNNPTSTEFNDISKNDLLLFQNQNMPITFGQTNIENFNLPLTNKNSQAIQNDIFILGTNKSVDQQPLMNGTTFNQNAYLNNHLANNLKPLGSLEGEMVYPFVPALKGLSANSPAALFTIPTNNHSSMNIQNLPTVPPNFISQFCVMNNNEIQSNQSNTLLKANPIYCMDTEHCSKSSYIKPGSYNPPQKPANLQKVTNNSVLIDNSPVTGVHFHYSNPQSNSKQNRSSAAFQSSSKIQMMKENSYISKCEDTWQATSLLVENIIGTTSANKLKGNSDWTLPESSLTKSHFLLDEVSCHSSSTDFKQDSGTEELSSVNNTSPGDGTSVVEADLNMNDWLSNLLINTDTSSGKETEESLNINETCSLMSDHDFLERTRTSKDVCQQQIDTQNSSDTSNDTPNGCVQMNCLKTDSVNSVTTDYQKQDTETKTETQKKFQRKNEKVKDDFITKTDQKRSPSFAKSKSTFKITLTKQVSYKLEDILNCVWNTTFSSLLGEVKPQKELILLELKFRRALYFETMKTKLTDHSYDTLEQALADFEYNFADIKNRNKGDKQCLKAVKALEKIFLDMVEKHFGILYQQKPQFFEPFDVSSNMKSRKQKKPSHRF